MPKLVPYTSEKALQGLNPAPIEQGMEAMKSGAYMVERFGSQVRANWERLESGAESLGKAYVEYHKSQSLIHGTSGFADLQNQDDKEWQDFKKTPQILDPKAVDELRERQQARHDNFLANLSGDPEVQAHFKEMTGNWSRDQFHSQTADIGNAKMISTMGALDNTFKQAQGMAQAGHMDQADTLLASSKAGVMNDSSLSFAERKTLEVEYEKANVLNIRANAEGMAFKDNTSDKHVALAELDQRFGPNSGRYPGLEAYDAIKRDMLNYASYAQQTKNQQMIMGDRAARDDYNRQQSDLILHPPVDAKGDFDPTAYMNRVVQNSNIHTPDGRVVATPGENEAAIKYGEYLSSGAQRKNDEGVFGGLMQGMAKGQMPTRAQVISLMGSTIGPHLDRGAGEFVLNQIAKGSGDDAKTISEGLDLARETLGKLDYPAGRTNDYTPGLKAGMTAYYNWFYPHLRSALATGATLDELLNPESPKSLTSLAVLKQFQRSDDDVMKAATGTTQGAVGATQTPAGETPAPAAPAPSSKPPLVINVGSPPESPGP